MGTWLSDRALIRIAGDDPRDFLQGPLIDLLLGGGEPLFGGDFVQDQARQHPLAGSGYLLFPHRLYRVLQ